MSAVTAILQRIYLKQYPDIHVILLLRNSTSELLKMADKFDGYSNKTTNYKSASEWVILSYGNLDLVHLHLQNVIILFCRGSRFVYPTSLVDGRLIPINCLNYEDIRIHPWQNSTCSVKCLFPNIQHRHGKHHLVIGTIVSPVPSFLQHHVDDKNRTVYTGILVELTEQLAKLLNFTFTFKLVVDGYGGQNEAGEWQGLVGQLTRQEVDMVIADLSLTTERSRVIDYILPPFHKTNLAALCKKGIDTEGDWMKIFRPFQGCIYLTILATIFFVAILFYLLTAYCIRLPGDEEVSKDMVLPLLHILIWLFGILCARGDGLGTKNMPIRILVVSFSMFCLILSGVYVGNLTASLTTIKYTKPFNNLDELVELPEWRWGMPYFELYEQIMNTSRDPILQKIWKGLVEFNKTDPSTFIMDANVHIDKLLTSGEKYVYIGPDSKYRMLNRNDCNVEIIDSIYSYFPSAIAVTKNSYLKSDLEYAMGRISDSGFLKTLEDKVYKDNRPSKCQIRKEKRPLLIDDISGAFFVALIGLSITVLVLLVEITARQITRSKTNKCR
ncbi:hypothetical protein SNE40_016245 [Patella caerulea]